MKVSELIERLREFDGQLEVVIIKDDQERDDDIYNVTDIEDEGDTLLIEVE